MTPPDLRALAQQGDPNAIALWVNQTLQPRGLTARVVIRADLLKILLIAADPGKETDSQRVPQQAVAEIEVLESLIRSLNLPQIQHIQIDRQYSGSHRPTRLTEFSLQPSEDGSRDSDRIPASTPNHSEPVPRHQNQGASSSHPRLPAAVLFPHWQIFRAGIYRNAIGRNAIGRLLLFLALLPLGINLLAQQITLAQTAWLTGAYFAIVWSVLFYRLIKPPQVSWLKAIVCVVFTVFIGIPLLLMMQRVPPFEALYWATGQDFPIRLVGFVLGVGVLEEMIKGVPVLLPLRHGRPISNPHTAAFYGTLSGLGFAVAESGGYSVQYAIALTRGQVDLGLYLASNTIRFVSLPLFHAVLSGIVGYFIGLAVLYPHHRLPLLLTGLAIAAVLHGFYNVFSNGLIGMVIIGFSLLLFIAYLDRSRL